MKPIDPAKQRRLLTALRMGVPLSRACRYARLRHAAVREAMRIGRAGDDDWAAEFEQAVEEALDTAEIGMVAAMVRATQDREIYYETTDQRGRTRTVTKHIAADWRAAEAVLKYRNARDDARQVADLRRRSLQADVERKELEVVALRFAASAAAQGGSGVILPAGVMSALPASTVQLLEDKGVTIIAREIGRASCRERV